MAIFFGLNVCKLFLMFLRIWQLPPRTVQVRPSMIKVSKDKDSNFSTFNALEVVSTRYLFPWILVVLILKFSHPMFLSWSDDSVVTSSCLLHPVIHQKEQSYQEIWLLCLALEVSLMNSFWIYCSIRSKSQKPYFITNELRLKVLKIPKLSGFFAFFL